MTIDGGLKPEGAPERSPLAGAGAPSGVDAGPKRYSVQRKMAVVARLLRGEPLDVVAREANVSVAKLTEWRDRALADNRRPRLVIPGSSPAVARTRQRFGKLRLQHRLDEAAHPSPDPVLDRVEPITQKQSFGGHSRLLRGIFRHGVVSVPARQRRNHLG